MTTTPIIESVLDSDLYKFTQAQAVLFGKQSGIDYQSVDVEYEFINRGGTKFPAAFAEALKLQVELMSRLRLHPEERAWLAHHCPYIKRSFLDWLAGYTFDPNEVEISQEDGLSIHIRGPWYRTIFWEVPLMAIISELYFKLSDLRPDGQTHERMKEKARVFQQAGLRFADFGTRRRFSKDIQRQLVQTCLEHANTFTGTSNVWLAYCCNTKPIGTHAHEWFQAHSALFGYRKANHAALTAWVEEFAGDLGIALPDTFTTPVFFADFGMKFAKLFDGVRQDSGNPIQFADRAIEHYHDLGINPMSKTIVFSDGLDIDTAVQLQKYCSGRIQTAFGIGTHLTNDCGHKPLNMVIKMVKCNDVDVVKLSDSPGKYTGKPEAIETCKRVLGIS